MPRTRTRVSSCSASPATSSARRSQGPRTIGEFCQLNYGVSFPMFAKIDVNGDDTHPLYRWLKTEKSGLLGGRIKWNFTKFLVGRDGQVIERFAPTTTPADLEKDVVAALAAPRP